jgi:hypothetical protein
VLTTCQYVNGSEGIVHFNYKSLENPKNLGNSSDKASEPAFCLKSSLGSKRMVSRYHEGRKNARNRFLLRHSRQDDPQTARFRRFWAKLVLGSEPASSNVRPPKVSARSSSSTSPPRSLAPLRKSNTHKRGERTSQRTKRVRGKVNQPCERRKNVGDDEDRLRSPTRTWRRADMETGVASKTRSYGAKRRGKGTERRWKPKGHRTKTCSIADMVIGGVTGCRKRGRAIAVRLPLVAIRSLLQSNCMCISIAITAFTPLDPRLIETDEPIHQRSLICDDRIVSILPRKGTNSTSEAMDKRRLMETTPKRKGRESLPAPRPVRGQPESLSSISPL